jgi:hypothetical protein
MIEVPNTTLCCIDCDTYDLAIKALNHCASICNFEKILFLTDIEYSTKNIEVLNIPSLKTKEQYSRFIIKELGAYIKTDFVLIIQYDGFIVNPQSWSHDFLKYDYIGAKWWWYPDGINVGNGGFSLRSKKLLQALSTDVVHDDFASLTKGEDTLICRVYRRFLEAEYKIKFAPETIADRFSHEFSKPVGKPFGFHGIFNIWRYIKMEDLEDFVNKLSPRTLALSQVLVLALKYHKMGQFKQAEIIYRRILHFSPDNQEVFTYLNLVHRKIVPVISDPKWYTYVLD